MSSFNYYQPVGASVWVIAHNLSSIFLAIDILQLGSGGTYQKISPTTIEIIDPNTVAVQFSTPIIGRARIVAS